MINYKRRHEQLAQKSIRYFFKIPAKGDDILDCPQIHHPDVHIPYILIFIPL